MDPAVAAAFSPKGVVFQDGLGERRYILDSSGHDALETLCLSGELTAIPSFEFALRERVSRLATFRHGCYGRVRSVDRFNDADATLALVSDRTPGARLADILTAAARQRIPLDINAALGMVRQLVPAVAMLHEKASDVAHGAIGPERLIVTPDGRLVIVEYVMGAALEQLRFSHARYWKELRIALPRSAGLPRFDHRADVTQLGVVALSLILGRLLGEDEYPMRIRDLVASAWATTARGDMEPLTPGLRSWLARALQLDLRNAFPSGVEARAALDEVLPGDGESAAPALLATFLTRCQAPGGMLPEALQPPPQASAVAVLPNESKSAPLGEIAADIEPRPRTGARRWPHLGAAAVVLIALACGGFVAVRRNGVPALSASSTGTLMIHTNPAGAQVSVDGGQRGMTPISLTLTAGAHVIELTGRGAPRTIPITITAGTQASQYLELPTTESASGRLQIHTDPPGAPVTVDGLPRGTSPITIDDLAPGQHTVVIASEFGLVTQDVTVEPGSTGSLLVPLGTPAGAPLSGWISVSSPVDVQLYENGRLLGSSQSDRVMVSTGTHQIEIVNEPLGYRVMRSIQVMPGKVAPIVIKLPNGTIALNAIPWAEVWIDGEKVGETPIGNLPVSIGPHEIVFRHPQLGEQRHAITVMLAVPARLSVDLRKK